MPDDTPIAYRADGRPLYDNTPTVVSVIISNPERMVMAVRRANNPGRNLLCLPGGFHMRGETWQEAGAREVLEETGITLKNYKDLVLRNFVTDEYGHNVAICSYPYTVNDTPIPQDGEALDVVWVGLKDIVESDWAFPLHFRVTWAFLANNYTRKTFGLVA